MGLHIEKVIQSKLRDILMQIRPVPQQIKDPLLVIARLLEGI